MTDERKGLPSASSADRTESCPGWLNLANQAGKHEVATPEMEIGNAIHDYLHQPAEEKLAALEEQPRRVAALCKKIASKMLSSWRTDWHEMHIFREKRFWRLDDNLDYESSCKPDVAALDQGHLLVLDYKTGWGDVPESPKNRQMRATVAILASRWIVEKADVALIQPNISWNPTVAQYGESAIKAAVEWWGGVCEKSRDPNAPRNPSINACRFCPAYHACPEGREYASRLSMPTQTPLTLAQAPSRISKLILGVKMAQKELDFYKEALAVDPSCIPGFKLGKSKTLTSIRPEIAAAAFGDHISAYEILALCEDISLKKLRELLKSRGLGAGESLKEFIETRVGDKIKTVITRGSLEEEKDL